MSLLSDLKLEATGSCETFVPTWQITQHNSPLDSDSQCHYCVKFKYNTSLQHYYYINLLFFFIETEMYVTNTLKPNLNTSSRFTFWISIMTRFQEPLCFFLVITLRQQHFRRTYCLYLYFYSKGQSILIPHISTYIPDYMVS